MRPSCIVEDKSGPVYSKALEIAITHWPELDSTILLVDLRNLNTARLELKTQTLLSRVFCFIGNAWSPYPMAVLV